MQIHRLPVRTMTGSYEVVIGPGLLADAGQYVAAAFGSTTSAVLLIYDQALFAYDYPAQVEAALRRVFAEVYTAAVPSGESAKSFAQAEQLYHVCIRAGLDRDAIIVALGGGVTGDLAGFVAATYMRGVHFVQMPTTLLAHDSSIGGKVAINLPPEGKNLVGAFHPPKLVLYDVSTLKSLPVYERSYGLAEAIKHGVIRDAALFDWLEVNAAALLAGEESVTAELLARSCQVKVDVVGVDEREAGLRAILNFGHTVGHAVEAYEEGRLSHGACVAIGMVYETRLAERLGVLDDTALMQRLRDILLRYQLPVDAPAALHTQDGVEAVIELMRHDKKAVRRSLSFVLPKRLGEVVIRKDIDVDIVRALLNE